MCLPFWYRLVFLLYFLISRNSILPSISLSWVILSNVLKLWSWLLLVSFFSLASLTSFILLSILCSFSLSFYYTSIFLRSYLYYRWSFLVRGFSSFLGDWLTGEKRPCWDLIGLRLRSCYRSFLDSLPMIFSIDFLYELPYNYKIQSYFHFLTIMDSNPPKK